MIAREKIKATLKGYKRPKIATICSHSALQIFNGAKQEGIETIGICTEQQKKIYDAFPEACPDKFMVMQDYKQLTEFVDELIAEQAVLIPHGTLVEYAGDLIGDLQVPIFGNREVLLWEKDREKMFHWMREAGLKVPLSLKPENIDRACIVKFGGAKGGSGYFVVSSYEEFKEKTKNLSEETLKRMTVQEYLVGVRFYPHYFYSPLTSKGYKAANGRLELLSVDKRVETNIDEIYRSIAAGIRVVPTFRVAGNLPVVIRESLLLEVMQMGEGIVNAAERLFGGIPGPFCIETMCDENFNFYAFEVSARIVAGTNLFPDGSPYSRFTFKEPMSTGRRIARELKLAAQANALEKVIY